MKRLRHRMISIFLSFGRASPDVVDGRLVAAHADDDPAVRAAFACRLPPQLSRCRVVFPLDAGIGQAPHSLANAASERIRSGLSPTRSSISAAVPAAIPWASIMTAHTPASGHRGDGHGP